MRTRTISKPFVATSHYEENTSFDYTRPPLVSFRSSLVRDTVGLSFPAYLSTLEDVQTPPPSIVVDPITHSWKRIKRQRPNIRLVTDGGYRGRSIKEILPVKPCVHDISQIRFRGETLVSHQRVNSAGNLVFERTDTRTMRFGDTLQLASRIFGSSTYESILTQDGRSTGDFLTHDWFALADQFSEACDQFIPSSTMLGESMIENDIFIDAFKIIVNPSNALRVFLKHAKTLGKSVRHMSLGRAAHHIAKRSSNAHLTWAFGIVPAISDIIDALDAHSRVSKRMKYLRENAGTYVPIRVKQELSSDYDPSPPSSNFGSGLSANGEWITSKKVSTAHIGCWGRVREDLNYTNDWSAYLQYFGINKVVGLAWELIPFSFVVDWFTNAQERINKLTRLRTGGPFCEFVRLCHSLKTVHSEDLYLIPGYDHSFGGEMIEPTASQVIASRDVIHYERSSGIPDTSGVLDFSALGLFHLLTGAGMIIQRT